MLLHKECLPTQLQEPAEQAVIAATFRDCDGIQLSPNTRLAKCSDIPAAQTLTLNGQVLSLSGGGSVTLPDQDTDAQQLSINGNVVSLTNGGSITLPTAAAPVPQVLSIAGNTVSLSGGGGSVTVPDNDAQQLSLSGNTLSLTNGGSVTLPAAAAPIFATPAEAQAGTSATLHINPADLYARENIAAQTGVSNDVTAIPAPAANESPWAINQLGETLHYMPDVGWKIVADQYGATTALGASFTPPPSTISALPGLTFTMPRAGKVSFSLSQLVTGTYYIGAAYLMKNGVLFSRFGATGSGSTTVGNWPGAAGDISGSAEDVNVAAGDVFSVSGQIGWTTGGGAVFHDSLSRFSYQYS
jgi:hypothetical protein